MTDDLTRRDLEARRPAKPRWPFALGALLLTLGATAGWLAHLALPGSDRGKVEAIVHEYVVTHPEILTEAMTNLHHKEMRARLGDMRGDLERPFPGAVLGNPHGKVTLVEFSDFACGFCRQSVADVDALVAANPDLRIVMRELPILSPESGEAARWALAAAAQGKYAAFHKAMFAAGRPDPATIAAAAQAAGLDLVKARVAIADPRFEAELRRNVEFARTLGFEGTPSWIAGDDVLTGAVGREALGEAIKTARG